MYILYGCGVYPKMVSYG